jgi:KTSC domain
MAKVDSSYIKSITFDNVSHVMTVHFTDGCIVKYFSVHPRTYNAIISAKSHGEKFTELVKDKNYKFVVVKAAA